MGTTVSAANNVKGKRDAVHAFMADAMDQTVNVTKPNVSVLKDVAALRNVPVVSLVRY